MIAKKNIKVLLFLAVLISIVFWQLQFSDTKISSEYTRKDATGLFFGPAKGYSYFYYYLDLFPLWTTYTPLEYSYNGANNIILNHSDTLAIENSGYISWGDNVKNVILLIDAYFKGSPENVTVRPFNIFLFVSALILVLINFAKSNKLLLGLCIVLLFGSNPFQLYEVYKNENIFGSNISVFLLTLGLFAPILFTKEVSKSYVVKVSVLAGIIFGTFAHIRMEVVSTILTATMFLILGKGLHKNTKLLGLVLLLCSFFVTAKAWEVYFSIKYNQTMDFMA